MATYNVKPETNTIIKEYAEAVGLKAEEALDKLIQTADSRRKALKKYAKKQSGAPKAAKKAKAPKGTSLAKKKAAPKAKAKKAPKARKIEVVVDESKAKESVAL